MRHVIYLDVYFAINFLMDYIILIIAKQLLRKSGTTRGKGRNVNCTLAAVLGAIYASFVLVCQMKYGLTQMVVTYIIVAVLMTGVAFRPNTKTELVKSVQVVYVVTFALNGIINYADYNSSFGKDIIDMATKDIGGFNLTVTMASVIIATSFLYGMVKLIAENLRQQGLFYDVVIVKGECEIRVRALKDTGNSLREPYGGKPVSVLEYNTVKENLNCGEKMLLIPFNSVGKENGMLTGMIADYMVVKKEKISYIISKPVIGLYKGTLSSSGKYSMLLHPDLMEGEGENDNDKIKGERKRRNQSHKGYSKSLLFENRRHTLHRRSGCATGSVGSRGRGLADK